LTGADGIAAVRDWTLGNSPGLNQLAARIAGVPDLVFTANGLAVTSLLPTLQREVLVTGLQVPWDFAILPDGAILFTERARGLSVRRADGSVQSLFSPPDLISEGQSGMNGLAIDPNFATNRTMFVYMASTLGGVKHNRVVRLIVNPGYTAISDRTDIVTGISYKATPAPGAPPEAGSHNGGRMRFGPDGYLYVTTGDTHHPMVPQSGVQLGGKVLRIDRNGSAAAGNNPPAGFDTRIYVYGLRNPQGLAFRPGTGRPFISEHGPNHSDEVTQLSAGGNGGWDPVCLDGVSYCGYGSNQVNGSLTPMTDTGKFATALLPAWANDGRSQGMGASEFLRGPKWKAWDGALAVSIMNGKPSRVEILTLDAGGTATSNTPVLDSFDTRIRALNRAADGSLYVSTSEKPGGDEIWRISPH
jgi:glucose/arabinose dehydrogenase